MICNKNYIHQQGSQQLLIPSFDLQDLGLLDEAEQMTQTAARREAAGLQQNHTVLKVTGHEKGLLVIQSLVASIATTSPDLVSIQIGGVKDKPSTSGYLQMTPTLLPIISTSIFSSEVAERSPEE